MTDPETNLESSGRDPEKMAARLAELEARQSRCLEMEEELRALRLAVDGMQLGLTITDIEGRIVYINAADAQMHGYTREELLGREVRIFAPTNLWKPMGLEEMRRIKSFQRDSVNRRKDGSLFPVRLLSDLITDAEGSPVGVVTTCEDIGERRKIEEELRRARDELEEKVSIRTAELSATIDSLEEEIAERRRAEQEKEQAQAQLLQAQKMEAVGKLSAGVAHDFNNILATVMVSSGLGLMKLNPDHPLCHDLKRIEAAVSRGARLTQQLLLFSRKAPVDFVLLDLNRTIEEMMKMLHRLLGEDITVETDLAPGLWTIRADEGNMEQVILNLAVNARDAMIPGGRLAIRTRNVSPDQAPDPAGPEAQRDRFVCLSVQDDGCGMPEEIVPRIFEPFFTTKATGRGTGLGLSVVYGIVSHHQGRIEVASRPGQGSTFSVYLPAVFSEACPLPEKERASRYPRGNGERILIVEDEKDVREATGQILRENGYLVQEAAHAAAALALFDREEDGFSLVISDVVLPDQNGIELADQLLKRKEGLHIVLMSGYTDDKSQLPRIREKGYRFLQKPFSVGDLLGTVEELFRKVSP